MGIEVSKKNGIKLFRAFCHQRDVYGGRKKANGPFRELKKEAQEDYERIVKNKGIKKNPTRDLKLLLKDLAEEWYNSRVNKRIEIATMNHYRSMLDNYLYPEIGMVPISRISPDFLEDFFSKIKQKEIKKRNGLGLVVTTISSKQYNHVVSTLRSIFNYGITHRKCDYNPANAIDKIRIPVQLFTYLDRNEVLQFLSYAMSKHTSYIVPYYVYLLGFNLGLRIGEIIALRWDHIDFVKKSILICDAYDKQAYKIKNYPKSKRYRILWMNRTVETGLRELRMVYPDSKYVFMNPDCTNHIYYRNFRCRIFLKDIKESGVSHFDLHGMRHTFAINYLLNNGNAHDLQLMLGHENITTTMKYIKFTDDYLKNKAGIVDFSGTLPEQVTKISDYLSKK